MRGRRRWRNLLIDTRIVWRGPSNWAKIIASSRDSLCKCIRRPAGRSPGRAAPILAKEPHLLKNYTPKMGVNTDARRPYNIALPLVFARRLDSAVERRVMCAWRRVRILKARGKSAASDLEE